MNSFTFWLLPGLLSLTVWRSHSLTHLLLAQVEDFSISVQAAAELHNPIWSDSHFISHLEYNSAADNCLSEFPWKQHPGWETTDLYWYFFYLISAGDINSIPPVTDVHPLIYVLITLALGAHEGPQAWPLWPQHPGPHDGPEETCFLLYLLYIVCHILMIIAMKMTTFQNQWHRTLEVVTSVTSVGACIPASWR